MTEPAKVDPVKVNVRVRPLNSRELLESAQVVLSTNQTSIRIGAKTFAFDDVFPSESSQDDVYTRTAEPLLQRFLEGYNCTMLAYGQTGSGKTFTMGTEVSVTTIENENRGIIPRLIAALFQSIEESGCPASFLVNVSMLEVYQEEVADLLAAQKGPLQLRESKETGFFVQGLSSVKVRSLTETMAAMERGCQARRKGTTAMNAQSSRSHAIFTVSLQKTAVDEDECSFEAKFHLVDLAGSERLKKTQAEGECKKEGIKINEGLLALGNVISALSDGLKHIPYRDSKITRILQDSLGGNSCTVMIACVSPADTNGEETLSTLYYADRAKKIKNKAVVNADAGEAMIKGLRDQLLQLRHENTVLRSQSTTGPLAISSAGNENILAEYKEKAEMLEKKCLELTEQKITYAANVYKIEERADAFANEIEVVLEGTTPPEEKLVLITDLLTKFKGQEEDDAKEDVLMEEDTEDEDGEDTEQAYKKKCHTMDTNLECLLDAIREKERILANTNKSDSRLEDLQQQHQQAVNELQEKITAIEKEKALLADELRKTSKTNKLAEERRKKLQELEKEMATYKKKLQDIRRLEQFKQQNEKNTERMRSEIDQLKISRVQLLKQIRAESEKHRIWRAKQDRQMMVMKNKEKKIEMEAVRTKRTLTLQLDVYRKKYQEAISSNKRLQEQLMQSSTRKHNGKLSQEQLTHMVEEEVSLLRTSQEVKLNLANLREMRKQLAKKLAGVNAQLSSCQSGQPTKKDDGSSLVHSAINLLSLCKQRRTGIDGESVQDDIEETKRLLEEEAMEIRKEIDNCQLQIEELQEDSSKIDPEARFEVLCGKLTSNSDGKVVLRALFEMHIAEITAALDKEKENSEIKAKAESNKALEEQRAEEFRQIEMQQAELINRMDYLQNELANQLTELIGPAKEDAAMITAEQFQTIQAISNQFNSLRSKVMDLQSPQEQQSKRKVGQTVNSGSRFTMPSPITKGNRYSQRWDKPPLGPENEDPQNVTFLKCEEDTAASLNGTFTVGQEDATFILDSASSGRTGKSLGPPL